MKIEKISDSQIRCTLNKSDLASREIKINELAYGTEKTKGLFRDMMQQASYEFGFEADDLPLMIEAIPMSAESIVLIITKVEDPEELDTRFSKFSPPYEDEYEDFETDGYDEYTASTESIGADEVLDYYSSDENKTDAILSDFKKLASMIEEAASTRLSEAKEQANMIRIYSFQKLKDVELLSSILRDLYYGKNSLYKDTKNTLYYLVLNKSEHSPSDFNRVCNILSEYGKKENVTADKESFFQEHFQTIIRDSALQILADI